MITTAVIVTGLLLRRNRRVALALGLLLLVTVLLLPPAIPTMIQLGHLSNVVVPSLSRGLAVELGVDVGPDVCAHTVRIGAVRDSDGGGWVACTDDVSSSSGGGGGGGGGGEGGGLVLYSFSVHGDGRFETAAAAQGFRVYWFDPTLDAAVVAAAQPNVTFRPWALGLETHPLPDNLTDATAWERRTLASVLRTLDHTSVDVLRIASGEDAWPALPDLVANEFRQGLVRQLLLEVHLPVGHYENNLQLIATLRSVQRAGFHAFYRDDGIPASSRITRLSSFGTILHCCFNVSFRWHRPASLVASTESRESTESRAQLER